mgnify:CR=1 FL=1
MNKKTIKRYALLLIMFVFPANVVCASVYINEVQLAPTEERFVELYNSGSSSVDLTNWYIQRKTATGTTFGTLVSKTYFENKTIPKGGYFLISKENLSGSDVVYSSLTLTESNTIQLKNSSQAVVDKIGWGDVSDCGESCASNPISGKSLQKTSGGDWIVADPTPKGLNDGADSYEDTEDSDTNDSENYVSETKKEIPLILKITTKIISPKIVVAGVPFAFSSLTTTNRGQTYMVGNFSWNLGDGMTLSAKDVGPFEYVYEYPGEYALALSYFDNSFSIIPSATDKINIKVVPSEITITGVGTFDNPFVELENKSNYDILLSNWTVTAGSRSFVIPEGTILLSGKSIKLSPRITGFTGEDIKSVVIVNTNKIIYSSYPSLAVKKTNPQVKKSDKTVSNNIKALKTEEKDSLLSDSSNSINLNELDASALNARDNISGSAYPFIGLLIIIGLGITSFLLFKKKNNKDTTSEKIRAEDLTIVE